MSETEYKVHVKFLNEADYRILVLTVPESDIEDKLAYLAREKGKITKKSYEDFLISTCTANINQLLYHLNNIPSNHKLDMSKIRDELVNCILEVNPLLVPSNVYLNRNYTLKLIQKDCPLEEGDKPLDQIKSWTLDQENILSEIQSELEKIQAEEESVCDKDIKQKNKKTPTKIDKLVKSKGTLKDIDSLEFSVIERWWKRLSRYVSVKQFKKEDAEHILARRYFHNRTSFQTFVVTVCIEDFEELFEILEDMGIPGRITPPILINELYELCLYCNDFLTFENAQALAEESSDEEEEDSAKASKKRAGASSAMNQYVKKKTKKRFKDVPKEDLIRLGDNMKVFLIGQNEAVDKLVDSIQRASVGLKDPNKPIGSFLLAGRSGVGKTLTSKILANELIKGRDNIVTIDCSEYSADHEYSKLIGAPSGYVGFEAGGCLTNALQKNPFCVVVFDEIEKASYRVHELLLQILEEGRLTDGKGKSAYFNDAIIIMTSNVGVKEIDSIKKTVGFGNVAEVTDEKKDKALNLALKDKFKPEFLNRIDSIINFRNLKKEDYMKIIDIELYKLNDNLKNNDTEYKNVELEFSATIKKMIYEKGIDDEYGARPLKRCIEREIATPLAKYLLSQKDVDNLAVKVSQNKDKTRFTCKKRNEKESVYDTEEYKLMENAENNLIVDKNK